MKALTTFTTAALLMLSTGLFAQAPNFDGFNYQAVVRDVGGQPLPNHAVGLRVHIFPGASNGYSETHSVNTDANGLVNIVMGQGTPEVGSAVPTFGALDWSAGDVMQYNVFIDITGGINYAFLGGGTFKAVPFAMHALSSGGDPVIMDQDLDGWAVPYDFNDTDPNITSIWNDNGSAISSPAGRKVGIGTTSPYAKFQVEGSNNSFRVYDFGGTGGSVLAGEFRGTASLPLLRFASDIGPVFWDIGMAGTENFVLSAYGGELMTATPDGDVGIGTTTPAAKLDVAGTFKLADGSEGAGKVLTSDADGLASWQAPETKAYFSATQYGQPVFTMASGVEYDADFASIRYIQNMTYSSGVITAQVSGIYHFDFLVSFPFGYTNTQQIEVNTYKNGGLYGQEFERALSLDVDLQAGETFKFTMRQHTGADVNISPFSRISGHKVD